MKKLILVLTLIGLLWPACVFNPGTGAAQCDSAGMPNLTVKYAENLQESKIKSNIMSFKVSVIQNKTTAPTENVTYAKYNGVWISSAVCKLHPELCVEAQQAPPPQPTTRTPVKTAAQCTDARAKDWNAFVWNGLPDIDYSNVAAADKESLLNNIAAGTGSNQYKCLYGG